MTSDADVLAYMDVDLSTNLGAFLPVIEDEGWLFDAERLLLAEARGLHLHEVPVEWVEDLDSRVHIVKTALDDVRGLLRMRRCLRRRQRPRSTNRRLTPI